MDNPIDVVVPSCHICQTEIITPDKCAKCGNQFCDEHTSKIDTKFCSACMNDVIVLDEKYTRTEESYDDEKDQVVTTKESCRVLKFQGQDWVWYGRKIRTLSDDELKTVLEYHRGMVFSIEHEITFRKVQAQFKTPAISIPITTTTQTKQVKKAKAKQLTPEELAAKIKAMGIDPSKLKDILGKTNG